MEFNTAKDISALTAISIRRIDTLQDLLCKVISDDVLCSLRNGDQTSKIDVGIGTISILSTDSEISYKFCPSEKMEKMLIDAIKSGISPLEKEIETALCKKIVQTSKTLL